MPDVHRAALAASLLIHVLVGGGMLLLGRGHSGPVLVVGWQHSAPAPGKPLAEAMPAGAAAAPQPPLAEVVPEERLPEPPLVEVELPPVPWAEAAQVAAMEPSPLPERTPDWLDRIRATAPATTSVVDPKAAVEAAYVPATPDAEANDPPPYPIESRRRGEQGTVLLLLQIDAQGKVEEVRLLRSSGHPRLDRAAAAALAKWRFRPARRGGVAEATAIEQPVEFRLR